MISLDTNVVSELLRPHPDAVVLAWSYRVPRDAICTASVVEAELRAGIERLPDGGRKRASGRDLDLYLGSTLGGRVFPLDRAAARFYAAFMAARERAGRPTGVPDALIAATARSYGARLLATRNTRDFEGCGVALVNPWDAAVGGAAPQALVALTVIGATRAQALPSRRSAPWVSPPRAIAG